MIDPFEKIPQSPSLHWRNLGFLRTLVRSVVVREGRDRRYSHPYWQAEADLDPSKAVEMTRPKAPYQPRPEGKMGILCYICRDLIEGNVFYILDLDGEAEYV